jgi:hypothetical protein
LFQNRTNTEYQLRIIFNAPSNSLYNRRVVKYCTQEENMNNRVITRERGVIPGCKAAGSNYGMAVDSAGRPWSSSPSDIDAYLAKLRAETRQSRINRGADPETGIKIVALRSDLAPEQRAEALRIGRIGFASAGAKRKPKEAIAA